MADGSANILHFNAVRIRVVGSGNLQLRLQGLNNIEEQEIQSITMAATDRKERTRLANFIVQYGKLRGTTTEINEVMRINAIRMFVKEMWSDYPVDQQ